MKPPKVCVADVANSSMQPVFSDQLKARLVEALQKKQVSVYSAFTATALGSELELSAGNRIVMRREKCDYMVLSEVVKLNGSPPSRDASAIPMLGIEFAMFKKGGLTKPVLQNRFVVVPADDLSTTVDRIAPAITKYMSK